MWLTGLGKYDDNLVLARKVERVRGEINGDGNYILLSPFSVAATRQDLVGRLEGLAENISGAVPAFDELTQNLANVDKEIKMPDFDDAASGKDIIAAELLKNPREERVRETFERMCGAAWGALEEMRQTARKEGVIMHNNAVTAKCHINTFYNGVRGIVEFYRSAPQSVLDGFIIR